MPAYSFRLLKADNRVERAESLVVYNDDGAMRCARRIRHSDAIEVWQQTRFVGRIDPPQPVAVDA